MRFLLLRDTWRAAGDVRLQRGGEQRDAEEPECVLCREAGDVELGGSEDGPAGVGAGERDGAAELLSVRRGERDVGGGSREVCDVLQGCGVGDGLCGPAILFSGK